MKLVEVKKIFASKYSDLKFIALGGNAYVYAAKDCEGNNIAIKILNKETDNYNEKRSRFIIETKKVLELQDKIAGIIPILDYYIPNDTDSELYWYIMPLATPIMDYINDEERLRNGAECILNLAITLVYLHSKEIVHRDIKPSNIYYYKGRYCLADFGLVDYPGKDDLTHVGEQLGAKATIAPEMKFNAKQADGKKADVYSLAKTLWMLLTTSKYGFEGIYNPSSTLMGVKNFFESDHLVELNQLLVDSTQDEPDLRPTMPSFLDRLYKWIKISSNFESRNFSQWKYVQTSLFHEAVPDSACWRNPVDIVNVLNLLGSMHSLNHMFIPTGGGLDLIKAEFAAESGCIALGALGFDIVKPRSLCMESIQGDFRWSYFRLDLLELQPIFDENKGDIRELVTEDIPGHYVSWKCGNYGYYEDGSKLPQGGRLVERYLNGSFVFFPKASIYNQLAGTYDSRHNKMSAVDFRDYIEKMREDYNSMDHEDFLKKYNENPFPENDQDPTYISVEETDKLLNYSRNEYINWDFYDICNGIKVNGDTSLIYMIYIEIGHEIFTPKYYVGISGKLCKEDDDDNPEINNKFIFYFYDDAQKAERKIMERIKAKCIHDNITWDEHEITVGIELYRIGIPKHIFTKEEIRYLLENGDDEKNNALVIDGDGYVRLIESPGYSLQKQYPVVHETYCAYNNYIGKFSSLSHLDDVYLTSLEGWLDHLISKRSVYLDIYTDKKEHELLDEISQFY